MDKESNQISLWIIKFCLKVLHPKYNLYYFLVYLAIKYRLWLNRKSIADNNPKMAINTSGLYEVRVVPDKIHQVLMKDSLKKENFVGDSTNVLIISKDSYKRFASENCFFRDGSTIWLSLTPHFFNLKDSERTSDKHDVINVKEYIKYTLGHKNKNSLRNYAPCEERIVQVAGSMSVPNHMIYVTETEIFNIKTNFKIPFEINDLEIKLKPIQNMNYVPKTAASMTLDMVLNQFDVGEEFVSNLLTNYFELPRCVRENDYVGIPLEDHLTTNYHYKYLDVIEHCNKLYFKCSKIFNERKNAERTNLLDRSDVFVPYFAVKGETELTTGQNFHSIVPRERYITRYMNEEVCRNIEDSMRELCPGGLHKYFDEMLAAILPFLIDEEVNPIHTMLTTPLQPIFLVNGPRGSGKTLLVKLSAKYYGLNHLTVDCNDLMSTTAKQTESKLHTMIQKAKSSSPAIVALINFESFAVDAENNEDTRIINFFSSKLRELFENYTKYPIIFLAVTEQIELKPNVSRIFLEKFNLKKPNKKRRLQMLEWFISVMNLKFCDDNFIPLIENNDSTDKIASVTNKNRKINHKKHKVLNKVIFDILDKIASKTETFSFGDIDTLIHFSLRNSFLEQEEYFEDNGKNPNIFLVREKDFIFALESMRALQSQNLDAPKIPNVYWEDIGGLDKLKKELLKTIEFPIKYPHLMKNSLLKRSGILLYGPPGCGKTLVAKALSTELNVSFLSVKGPELLNMYIGQSEENVRKVFESARASAPCLVFMDELESLAPKRGALGDSGGASDRVVSQLLAEIDGVVTNGGDGDDGDASRPLVFVMGATNRPDLLEQSLLRPGRLDKLIYVGPYEGNREKEKVLKALCRSHKLSNEVSLTEVVSALPDRCTGADLLHVVSQARSSSVRKLVNLVQEGVISSSDLSTDSLVLCKDDFEEGISTFKPSVTDEEFAHYENLKLQISP